MNFESAASARWAIWMVLFTEADRIMRHFRARALRRGANLPVSSGVTAHVVDVCAYILFVYRSDRDWSFSAFLMRRGAMERYQYIFAQESLDSTVRCNPSKKSV